jgi:hypothetical protein
MRRSRLALVAAAATLAPALAPAAAYAASTSTLYYERSLMREADARCGLFAPKLGQALAASTLQVRGAALRAGASPAELDAAAARARDRADREPCGSPALSIAAQRVRAAFMSWSRQASLSLPGTKGAWTAQRWPVSAGPYWTLSTPAALAGRPATLGLRRQNSKAGDHLAVWSAAPEARAAFALRLLLRDPARAADPYLSAGPPPGAARAFLAAERRDAPQGGVLFELPDAALAALSQLDPRESVRVELSLPGVRDRTISTDVEVGDFAAGRAFLAAGG